MADLLLGQVLSFTASPFDQGPEAARHLSHGAVLVDADTYVDVSDEVADYDEAFFGSGGLARLADVVASRVASGEVEPLGGQRIGAPIARPHQILCIGLNYSDHAAETGQRVPAEPILFTKSPNTLIGPNDDVRIPRGSTKTDWEVELGIVIGSRTSYLDSIADAAGAIGGRPPAYRYRRGSAKFAVALARGA